MRKDNMMSFKLQDEWEYVYFISLISIINFDNNRGWRSSSNNNTK